ncbi:hypothetical protein [Nonomuraea longicatena]|uniref:MucB/RseB N-terminal domain-containing protein n=1 Tax=Nonomuraea longicatena TaxID=83682 RepID=A0ABP4B9U1_9ACTN
MLEQELRQAMAEDAQDLRPASDLVDQVVRRSRRRTRRRRGVLAAALALAVGTAGTGWLITDRKDPDQVATARHVTSAAPVAVGGVTVGYLPEGLGAPRTEPAAYKGLQGSALVWPTLRITVYQGLYDVKAGTATVRGRPVAQNADRTELLWQENGDTVVQIRVAPALKGELRRIADELSTKPQGGERFTELRLTHFPPDAHVFRKVIFAGPQLSRSWVGADHRSIQISTVRSEHMPRDWVAGVKFGAPFQVNGTTVRPGPRGHSLYWEQPKGTHYRLAATSHYKKDLRRIIEGIRPVEDTDPRAFGSLDVGYLPANLRSFGDVPTWASDGRWISLQLVEGAVAKDLAALKAGSERLQGGRSRTVGGRPAWLGHDMSNEVLLWMDRPGYGVRLYTRGLPQAEIQRIAEGVTVR